jgi:hypothetical protein
MSPHEVAAVGSAQVKEKRMTTNQEQPEGYPDQSAEVEFMYRQAEERKVMQQTRDDASAVIVVLRRHLAGDPEAS